MLLPIPQGRGILKHVCSYDDGEGDDDGRRVGIFWFFLEGIL